MILTYLDSPMANIFLRNIYFFQFWPSSEGNRGSISDQSANLSVKIRIFQRFFKHAFCLFVYYFWWKFQQNRTIFGGVRSPDTPSPPLPPKKEPFHECWISAKNFSKNFQLNNHKCYTDEAYHDYRSSEDLSLGKKLGRNS